MGGSIRATLTALALAALAGCQGTPRPIDNDPLVGGGPAASAVSAGAARRDDSAVRARSDVPPVPPANTTTSPAALTVGAITPPPSTDRRPAAQGITLGGPRPKGVSSPAAPPDETRSHAAPLPASGGDSYEGLQQRLQARGIVWQQLKMVERDRWDFYCAIPDQRQPNVRRNYEARGRASAVEAMREVLAEIESDRR
ncbi:MAG: hypothetical protein U0797_08425 [Gemmataceae bacterium]